jgi:hypothetical protein
VNSFAQFFCIRINEKDALKWVSDGDNKEIVLYVFQNSEPSRSYAAGVILNEDGILPDISLISTLADYGYSVVTFPKITHALVVTLPYSNHLSLQMGLSRVYRKLVWYIEVRNASFPLKKEGI